jgi:hypothetical protein
VPIPGKILVIALNPAFRRSISFALEAEGHVVTSHAILLAPEEGRGYDCVVLDHRAANVVPREAVLDFCAHSPRVILLAGHPEEWLASRVFRVVRTPQVGDELSVAVRTAIDDARSASRAPVLPSIG